MTCHEFWNKMPELAAGAGEPGHALECPACAALLERHHALAAGLRRMTKECVPPEASPALETRLIEAFRNQSAARRRIVPRYWLAWASAAALLIVAFFLTVGRHAQPANPALADLDSPGLDSEFVPLPYDVADPALPGAAEDPDLVRVEVPRSALIALGLPVAETGAPRVEAVVALGADGMLRGIQIVQ